MVGENSVQYYGNILSDKNQPMKRRFRALFALRNIGGKEAIEQIAKNFSDKSALLKHELAYCLGQMRDAAAVEVLIELLNDSNQEPIVRHEAGEALAAIGLPAAILALKENLHSAIPEIRETCELACERLQYLQSTHNNEISQFNSTDPAPPFPSDKYDIDGLKKLLLNEKETLWNRYRAMFTLRDMATVESIAALNEALHCPDSALFRHEVAFVLGQICSPASIEDLKKRLEDRIENCMVRHEAAESLGNIAASGITELLREYLHDPEAVVRESCEVALDIVDYANSDEFNFTENL